MSGWTRGAPATRWAFMPSGLKAIALARNRGVAFSNLTTVNLDFMRMYRPLTNVVARPTANSGKGYSLVGHHEIMIPLLAAALLDKSHP